MPASQTDKLSELERRAKEATPGPWAIELAGGDHGDPNAIGPIRAFDYFLEDDDKNEANLKYVAFASPDVILDLIARLRMAEEALTEIAKSWFNKYTKPDANGVCSGSWACLECDMGGSGHQVDEGGHDLSCPYSKARECLKKLRSNG